MTEDGKYTADPI